MHGTGVEGGGGRDEYELPPLLWVHKNYTVVLKFFNKVTEHLLSLAYVNNILRGERGLKGPFPGMPSRHAAKVNNIFIMLL